MSTAVDFDPDMNSEDVEKFGRLYRTIWSDTRQDGRVLTVEKVFRSETEIEGESVIGTTIAFDWENGKTPGHMSGDDFLSYIRAGILEPVSERAMKLSEDME